TLTKWKPIEAPVKVPEASAAQPLPAEEADSTTASQPATTILQAPLPPSVLPRVMADASAIANVIVSKYDDVLPLHRQERISARHDFPVPRSPHGGGLTEACSGLNRIVLALFAEAKSTSF